MVILSQLPWLQVGGREDSNVYIGQKLKNAGNIGVDARHVQLQNTATQDEVRMVDITATPLIIDKGSKYCEIHVF